MGDAFTLGNGRYRLVTPLGEGGMATVWRGIDGMLGAERAIKVLSAELSTKRKVRQRFDNEARAMGRLSHPNVVQVFDIGVEHDRPFMVMELADGGSADDWCKHNGPMPPRHVCDVAIALLDGLAFAHERGIVHRDVMPANILLTRYGLVKISDFGIAHVEDVAMTRTGSVMGTWAFMAPEQKTDAKVADARSDVFAVGATIVALLTAAPPDDLLAPESTAALAASLPAPLAEIVRSATRLLPEDRFQSATDMADAIRAILPEIPPDLTAPPLGEAVLPPLPEIPTAAFDAPVEAAGTPDPEYPAGWGASAPTIASEPPPEPRVERPPPRAPYEVPSASWAPADAAEAPSWLATDAPTAPVPPPAPPSPTRPAGIPTAAYVAAAALGMAATAAFLAIATIYSPPPAAPTPAAPPPSPFIAEPLHPELQPGYVPPPPEPPAEAPAAPAAAIAPPPKAARPAKPAAPKAAGSLTLLSVPHADVDIDGRAAGDTRALTKPLPIGTHRIDMTSFITGKQVHFGVEIQEDTLTTVCWSFKTSAECTDAELKTAKNSQ